MIKPRNPDRIAGLVRELCRLPHETEWVEFKVNQNDPQLIGEYLSALSNGAALGDQPAGYLVWGVKNGTHAIVGTRFSPSKVKKGNEPLEAWLFRLLRPRLDFRFHEAVLDEGRVVVLEIDPARTQPAAFSGQEFFRIGGVKKPLREYPEKERALWRIFDRTPFGSLAAAEGLDDAEVARLLDGSAYFDRLRRPVPASRRTVLSALEREGLIRRGAAGGWDISNLGGLLLARRLADFPRLGRKALRVVRYDGRGRTADAREWEFSSGYAVGFDRINDQLDALLPSREVLVGPRRKIEWMFPPAAVRELVANALIHQDFEVRGAGPMVEIFERRLEITNPGESLVATDRFVDAPPKSRNEELASLMRRFDFCEERGIGIDKVVEQVEAHQLPPPLFDTPTGSTRIVLYARRGLGEMTSAERIRACYLHASLRHLGGDFLTNASLRKRLGIGDGNAAQASRMIRDAVKRGVIAPYDPDAAKRSMKYIPWWAAPEADGGEHST